jgi:hypothetical protein
MKCLFYFFALLQTFHDFLDFHDFITDYSYRNFPGRGVYLNAFSLFDFFGFIVTYKVQKVMCLFPDADHRAVRGHRSTTAVRRAS